MKLFELTGISQNVETLAAKIERYIVVITTNTNGLKETGFGSLETCKTFSECLKERYEHVAFQNVATKSELDLIVRGKPDLVVLCCKYMVDADNGEKTWFSEYFSDNGISHTGSDRLTLEFDSNKSKAKTVLLNSGIATASFFIAHPGQFAVEGQLPIPLPLFIKPLDAANGNGIDENSIVHDFESYRKKVADLFQIYQEAVLVEEILPGREFTVAVFDNGQKGARSIIPIEIIPPKNSKGDRILGCVQKRGNEERVKSVEEPLNTDISFLVNDVFTALGARDFGRIDVKLNTAGKPYFLEANLVPGMTPDTSYFPRACALSSQGLGTAMTHKDVALKIVELALNRTVTTAPLSSIPAC